MLDELFLFPIVLVDGDGEEKKMENKLKYGISIEEEEDLDLIFAEAEYPYYTFLGIEDRWLPTAESIKNAGEGKFDACVVRFANVGQLLVPWSKSKFKREIKKFGDDYEKTRPRKEDEYRILTLRPEDVPEEFKKIIEDKKNNKDNKNNKDE